MNQDYKNFVERMGSFEDTMDVSGENLTHNALAHFGVLGMKWGRRKSNNIVNAKWTSSDGKNNTPLKINATTIGAAARTGQTVTSLGQTINTSRSSTKSLKLAKNLSDDDLKKLTTRLNLENNYVSANVKQTGKSTVEGVLTIAGGVLATASSAAILYETIKKFK